MDTNKTACLEYNGIFDVVFVVVGPLPPRVENRSEEEEENVLINLQLR